MNGAGRVTAAQAKVAEVRALVEANGWTLERCTISLPDEGFRYEVESIAGRQRESIDTTGLSRSSLAMRKPGAPAAGER